jgi:hypothetical protein
MDGRGRGDGVGVLLIVLACVGLGITGCAHKVPLQAGTQVPAAEGQVKLTEGPSGNTKIRLEVEHLADAANVAPGASTYVVWIQSAEGSTRNVGTLLVGDDRRGRLDTTTPHRQFQLFITAEPTATATAPSGQQVMFASIRK